MAVKSETITVGTTPTILVNPNGRHYEDPMEGQARVPAGGVTVYIGGSDVTTTTGEPLTSADVLKYSVVGNDKIYGVVAAATQDVRVMRTRA